MKTSLIFIFLIISSAAFSQVSMSDETYDKLNNYKEELAKNRDAEKPDDFNFKKIGTWYCREKYDYQFDYIINNQTDEKIGIFITCIKEKNNADKYRYLILPFGNENLFNLFLRDKDNLGMSMEMFLDKGIAYVLSKVANQVNSVN